MNCNWLRLWIEECILLSIAYGKFFRGISSCPLCLASPYSEMGRNKNVSCKLLSIVYSYKFLHCYLQGGVYLVNFLNVYGPGLAILFVVFVEAAGVFWFYGVENFSDDVEAMLGERPGLFWRICWQYISPVFLLVSKQLKTQNESIIDIVAI